MNDYSFKDLTVGQKESFVVTITSDMMDSFLRITNDVNPLHTNDTFAVGRGFESKVVYGMLTASFYSTLVGVHLPGEKALFQSLNTTFNNPVYVNQKVVVEGEIIYMNEAFKLIEIAATISSPDGKIFSKAKIKAGVLE